MTRARPSCLIGARYNPEKAASFFATYLTEMARVISIHEYDLRPDTDEAAFEHAIRDAERRGLFGLAGLVEHHFLKGIKGARRGAYAGKAEHAC